MKYLPSILLAALLVLVPSRDVFADPSPPGAGNALILTMHHDGQTLRRSLPRELMKNRKALRSAVLDAYGQARQTEGAKGSAKDDSTWRLQLFDSARGRCLFDLHLQGGEVPARSSLYEFVLHLEVPERSDPLEYRILIDREGLRRFNWNRRDFVKEHLEKARRALALDLGYGRTRSIGDLRDFVSPTSWTYEIRRFREENLLHQGSSRNPEGEAREAFRER